MWRDRLKKSSHQMVGRYLLRIRDISYSRRAMKKRKKTSSDYDQILSLGEEM